MADEGELLSGTEVKTALVVIQGVGLRSWQYVNIEGRARVEGCIDLGSVAEVEAQNKALRANPQQAKGDVEAFGDAIKAIRFRWRDKIVPFTIDPRLPDPERVTQAIEHWHQKTPMRFAERKPEHRDFVTFRPGSGCSSSVGRQGGQQFVNLGPECSTGNCIHEIGHTIGLWHEQSRIDRDLFIQIDFQNIIPGMEHNFLQHVSDGIDLGGYDYGSIMHYPATAFSKNGQPTIIPVGGQAIGQRQGLSAGDIAAVKEIYP
jgi:Astacin (Peptidase family M12A)